MKAVIVAALVFMVMDASATGVAVPTNIINAPKAQFIGSMVTSNPSSISKIPPAVTAVNPLFKDCAACNSWLDNSTLATAKFTNVPAQTSWTGSGFVGYVGNCIDSNTGLMCGVAE